MTNTNYINKQVTVTYRNGEQVTGTVFDANDRYLHVSGEFDSFEVDTQTDKVELVRTSVKAESVVAEDAVHANLKDAKKTIERLVRYADNSEITVKVYDFDESGEQGFEVEIEVEADAETDYISLNTYGQEKDALKRAKAVLKTVQGWNLTAIDGEVLVHDTFEVYSN